MTILKTYITRFFIGLICCLCGSYLYADGGYDSWRVKDAVIMSRVEISTAPAVVAEILWRLPFAMQTDTSRCSIRIFNVNNDMEITNLYVREINTERLTLAFEPLGSGVYEIYYIPTKQISQDSPDVWIEKFNLTNYPDFALLPRYRSTHVEIKGRPTGNPYDRTATDIRTQMYYTALAGEFDAHYVSWRTPLPSSRLLPEVWAKKVLDVHQKKSRKKSVHIDTLTVGVGKVAPLSIGVVSTRDDEEISISFSTLTKGLSIRMIGDSIKHLSKGEIATFWAVIEAAPTAICAESYLTAHLSSTSGVMKEINMIVNVVNDEKSITDDYIARFISMIGDREATEENMFNPLINSDRGAVMYDVPRVEVNGFSIKMDHATSLISSIRHKGRELLDAPITLVFASANGTRKLSVEQTSVRNVGSGVVKWSGEATTHDMKVEVAVYVFPYGRVDINTHADFMENIDFKNISLEFDFAGLFKTGGIDETTCDNAGVYHFNPKKDNDGIWVAGDSVAVCLTLPRYTSNAFYNMPHSSISLYRSSGYASVVSTGAFTARASTGIDMNCSVQMLPSGGARHAIGNKISMWEEAGRREDGDDILLVRGIESVYNPHSEASLRAAHSAGRRVMLLLDGYTLSSSGVLGRILESMGYKYEYTDDGRYMKFEPCDEIKEAFLSMQTYAINKDYISGVVISPDVYTLMDLDRVYAYKKRKGGRFSIILKPMGVGMNSLLSAPWGDALWGEDADDVNKLHAITGLPVWE